MENITLDIDLFYKRLSPVDRSLSTVVTRCYCPAAGDTTLGVASVLLVLGALLVVELLLLGKPEFGAPLAMPLSELGVPGVP